MLSRYARKMLNIVKRKHFYVFVSFVLLTKKNTEAIPWNDLNIFKLLEWFSLFWYLQKFLTIFNYTYLCLGTAATVTKDSMCKPAVTPDNKCRMNCQNWYFPKSPKKKKIFNLHLTFSFCYFLNLQIIYKYQYITVTFQF